MREIIDAVKEEGALLVATGVEPTEVAKFAVFICF
jgi:hypothetical protein